MVMIMMLTMFSDDNADDHDDHDCAFFIITMIMTYHDG